ncbi:protein-disulfide reductase DsbD domain-containing protein [Rhizobium ruizarguesonis]|jgi:DsbC/DsbD-like thiol-disulfide interchange protein|uniref:Cytochrome C biogenesis protein n=1 Tax=Rhizobium ruizarguesonis TaxID=2081791 RepID=A0AAE8QAE0_9HYPH|nr:protein-disulfide reductase DsbD domain-containing protein [Rhizobium ruizarguesonis]MBY5898452.1 cytochrome C biogenesis protein [Rhizobium leguminosarum]QND21207.1 cytochrome C biogenesis protein [Rhizobium leguminosarum bv. viciae]MBC2802609.1 cytochrome C biogenesis protein [Rhizobium ruizarguesonis]MCB2406102.1 cytochrome C biogenesis protein [Rhizobium ruizarguesonis]NEJ02861.1 cytochrome C biogenesis protein [Rhizobium ruizarguesonis]
MMIISLAPRRFLIAAVSMAAALVPFSTIHAEMSAWAENDGGRMRLVALAPDAAGKIRAALQIEPKPGWITYWKEPGNSGIPPQITITPESGVSLDAIAYPVPKHFFKGGIEDIAYDAPVTLPLSLTAAGKGPVAIDASAFIGICKDICIPFQANFQLKLGPAMQSHPEEEAILQAADASLPKPPSVDFGVTAHAMSPDRKTLSLTLALPGGGPGEGKAAPDIIVTGPSGYAFTKQIGGKRDGAAFKVDVPIGKLPKDYDISGKQWNVLVIDGEKAMETTLAFE